MLYLSSEFIKEKASAIGFQKCGISKAEMLNKEATALKQWLDNGFNGGMGYMQNYFDKRTNPSLLFENAHSVISVLLSYNPSQPINGKLKIAKFAYGRDYHSVIKEKLYSMIAAIQSEYPQFHAIPYVDSAPVMDKAWAVKSGLGWLGKNGCLINAELGSFCFIGEIVCNAVTEYDTEVKEACSDCSRCIDACPNKAFEKPYVLNANKCTSYHTIENKSEKLPESLCTKSYIFGCDICQNSCPYNTHAPKNEHTPDFYPSETLVNLLETGNIKDITPSEFKKLVKNTAFSRISHQQFMRNIGAAE